MKKGNKVVAKVPNGKFKVVSPLGVVPIMEDRVCEILKVYTETQNYRFLWYKGTKTEDWCIVRDDNGNVNKVLKSEVIAL